MTIFEEPLIELDLNLDCIQLALPGHNIPKLMPTKVNDLTVMNQGQEKVSEQWLASKFIEVLDYELSAQDKLVFLKPIDTKYPSCSSSSSSNSTSSSSLDDGKNTSGDEKQSNCPQSSSDSGSLPSPVIADNGFSRFVRKLSGNMKKTINLKTRSDKRVSNQESNQSLELDEQRKKLGYTSNRRPRGLSVSLNGRSISPFKEFNRTISHRLQTKNSGLMNSKISLSMIGAPEIESEILNITAAPCSNIKFSTPVRNFDNQGGFPAGGRGLNGRTERTRKPKTPYPTLPSRPKIERSNSTTDLFSKELQSNQQNSKLTLSETNQVDSVPAMSSFEVLNRRSNSRPRPSLPETMIRGTRITAADHNDQSPESFRLNFSNFERSRFNYQRCSSFLGRSDEDEVEEDEFETDCSNDRSRQYNPVWWSNSP